MFIPHTDNEAERKLRNGDGNPDYDSNPKSPKWAPSQMESDTGKKNNPFEDRRKSREVPLGRHNDIATSMGDHPMVNEATSPRHGDTRDESTSALKVHGQDTQTWTQDKEFIGRGTSPVPQNDESSKEYRDQNTSPLKRQENDNKRQSQQK